MCEKISQSLLESIEKRNQKSNQKVTVKQKVNSKAKTKVTKSEKCLVCSEYGWMQEGINRGFNAN